MAQSDSQEVTPPELEVKKTPNRWVWVGTILVTFLVGCGLGVFVPLAVSRDKPFLDQVPFVDKGNEQLADQTTSSVTKGNLKTFAFETLPTSQVESYALEDDEKLVLVPLKGGEAIKLPGKITWGSGSAGRGESRPLSAPDSKVTAFIDANKKLILITADGQHQVKVSDDLTIDYLTAWSPDSRRLVVHASMLTIESAFTPEGPVPEDSLPKKVSIPHNGLPTGFYLVDLDKGEFSHLSILTGSGFVNWIDNDRILVSIGADERYVIYNINSREADISILGDEFARYNFPQFSFSHDGKKWALTLHGKPIEGVTQPDKIVYASFPELSGTTVDEGPFASVQQPQVSPDGKNLFYVKYDYVGGPNYVQFFDGKQTQRLFEGYPMIWVNNTQFLYGNYSGDEISASNPHQMSGLSLYDFETKQSRKLYTFTPDK